MFIQIATIDFEDSTLDNEVHHIITALTTLGYEAVIDGGFDTDRYYLVKKVDGDC